MFSKQISQISPDQLSAQAQFSWVTTPGETTITIVQDACRATLGYSATELESMSDVWLQLSLPEDQGRVREAMKALEATGIMDLSFRVRHKDGNVIWLNNRCSMLPQTLVQQPLISGITTNITSTQDATTFIRKRIQLESILRGVSSGFVKGGDESIDEQINEALRLVGEFADIDRSYIFRYDGDTMSNTHEWVAPGTTAEKDNLQDLPLDMFPWWNDQLKHDRVIYITDLSEFPPEAKQEREILEAQNIVSILVVPLQFEQQVIGFMGFDAVHHPVQWSNEDIQLLRTMSDIMANGIKRKEANLQLKEAEFNFRQMADNISEVFYLSDPKAQKILYISKAFEDIWGIPRERLYEHMPRFIESILPEDQPKVIRFLQEQAEGKNTEVEYQIVRPDGSRRWINDRAVAILDEDQQVHRVSGIAADITRYKLNAERLKGLQRISQSLIEGGFQEHAATNTALLVLNELVPCTAINLVLLEESTNKFKMSTKLLDADNVTTVEVNMPVPADEVELRITDVFSQSVSRYTNKGEPRRILNHLLNEGWQDAFVFPLRVNTNKVGVLIMSSDTLDYFTPEHIEIAGEASSQLALSIYHNSVYSRIESYSSELETTVQKNTADIINIMGLYSSIMNNTDISIIILDAAGNLVECNPATIELLGYGVQLHKGSSIEHLHDPEFRNAHLNELSPTGAAPRASAFSLFTHRLQNKLPNNFEWAFLRADGRQQPVLLTINAIKSADPKQTKYVLIASDISEQKKAEQQLKQALEKEYELNRLKSAFVTTTSHQFRTPLTSIQTSIELLNFYLEESDPSSIASMKNHISNIQSEIQKLGSLMGDILTLGRVESGNTSVRKEMHEMNQLVADVIESYFTRPGQMRAVQWIPADQPLMAFVDHRLLSHAISNLVSNAIKYSTADPVVKTYADQRFIYIEVSDKGIGIPEAELSRLFDSFYRASNAVHYEGTGLGLVIVKEFTELNGGMVRVRSEINKGSTFTIILPKS